MDSKEEIKQFLENSEQTVLVLKHTAHASSLYEWRKLKSPLRVILNAVIIHVCRYLPPAAAKSFLLRSFLRMNIGKNIGISAEVGFDRLFPELITIDDNVIIGWKAHILTHEFTQQNIRLGRVHIKENALIGAFSTIRSGVTIGENSIVAMNSFVNKDVPDNELWGGVPAKKIKTLRYH